MNADFVSVTELSNDSVTREQVERMCHRYYWAANYCQGRDTAEAGCGTGQGAGYLAGLAKSYQGGDYSGEILAIARAHYGERIRFLQFDAQDMPFPDRSLDVVVLFEALYYVPSAERFAAECRRVLRPGGTVLVATANKDLSDFNPSPYSTVYHGVRELEGLFDGHGFDTEFFGFMPVDGMSLRQRLLRPIKKIVVSSGLMPKTMAGKKLLKRLVFGSLVPLTPEITAGMAPYRAPDPLVKGQADVRHKVIYCAATMRRG